MLTFTSAGGRKRDISEGYLDSRYIWAWAPGCECGFYGVYSLLRDDIYNGILDAVFTEQVGEDSAGIFER